MSSVLTVDGTNARDIDQKSVSDWSETPPCYYPTFTHMCIVMTRYGCGLWRARKVHAWRAAADAAIAGGATTLRWPVRV